MKFQVKIEHLISAAALLISLYSLSIAIDSSAFSRDYQVRQSLIEARDQLNEGIRLVKLEHEAWLRSEGASELEIVQPDPTSPFAETVNDFNVFLRISRDTISEINSLIEQTEYSSGDMYTAQVAIADANLLKFRVQERQDTFGTHVE